MKPKLIIASGPQGSGNHLFAKIFGCNPNIFAWPKLQEKYWEGHDMEPFAEYWHNPSELLNMDTSSHSIYYASQGSPYIYDGEQHIPDYQTFDKFAVQKFDVAYMIIGRDRNILKHQQTRVRGKHTTPIFLQQHDFFKDKDHTYACQELVYLYGLPYVNNLEKQLGIPADMMNTNEQKVAEILSQDKNEKYMSFVEYSELDDLIKLASSKRGAV